MDGKVSRCDLMLCDSWMEGFKVVNENWDRKVDKRVDNQRKKGKSSCRCKTVCVDDQATVRIPSCNPGVENEMSHWKIAILHLGS